MKFKELMDRYKKGLASKEEIIIVKQEIEKFEIIEEYLSENMDLDFAALNNRVQNEESIILKKKRK